MSENFETQEQLADADLMVGKHLTFSLGNEEYAIEIKHVTEIIGIQKITHLPDLPEFLMGVINLRGKVIPVIDVRRRFGFEPRAYDERTCINVVRINDVTVGLIVDSVSEVLDIPAEQIDPAPEVRSKSGRHYIQGLGKIGENVKIILDLDHFLFADELEAVASAAN
jgi:purine-binding chemotaxis protein CheW